MIRMSDAGPNPRTSTHLFYQQKEETRTGTKTKQQIRNKTDGKFSCLSFFDQKVLSAKKTEGVHSQNSNTIRITEYQGDFNLFLTKKCYPQKNV